jgi:sugar/nucleoside kinase (ribokinase family)
MPEVVCMGILVADVIAKPVDVFPERGKLLLADQMELHMGGCAANTGIGLARLGVETAVIGKVGNDGFGDYVRGFLEKNGMDVRGIVRSEKRNTSATMVMVHSDAERSFIHYTGANADLRAEDIDLEIIRGAKILHYAGALLMPGFDGEAAASILKQAQQMGVTTCIDTAWDGTGQWMKTLEPVFQYVDVAIPSIEEARMLTGQYDAPDVAQALMDRGVKIVGLKSGVDGCYCRRGDEEVRVPIYRVEAVDATGAGDAFAAGFLAGMVMGWSLEETAKLANAVGALCCQAIGTTAGIRSLEETLEFMRTTPFVGT